MSMQHHKLSFFDTVEALFQRMKSHLDRIELPTDTEVESLEPSLQD